MERNDKPLALLSEQEISLARKSLDLAVRAGADDARISLSKCQSDMYGTLNGVLDKVSHSLDRALTLCLYADGRFGSFSTNRISEEELRIFMERSVGTVRKMAPDPWRMLPQRERTEKGATGGNELGLYDAHYHDVSPEERKTCALRASAYGELAPQGLLSEEGEYADSLSDTLILDTGGLCCRHTETSFEYGVEATVLGHDGQRYSSYWWEAGTERASFDPGDCARKAFRRATAQIGPVDIPSGKYNLVLESECAARVVTPLLSALGGYALQQKNSFLLDSLGKQVFSRHLTLVDAARRPHEAGSRLFDSEGVATKEASIIENGTVQTYFLNTYMAGKMGMSPTVEDATRPMLLPCGNAPDLPAILRETGSGILVTGFNGGNSNPATGAFSYGIDGFLFRNGAIVHPVREMLITGNLTDLWNRFLLAGNDARRCMSKLIPTLAFENVDFSA